MSVYQIELLLYFNQIAPKIQKKPQRKNIIVAFC